MSSTMNATDYEKILSGLTVLSRVLDANRGQLTPADIRIRCLVNITAKETKRALRETESLGSTADADAKLLAPEQVPVGS